MLSLSEQPLWLNIALFTIAALAVWRAGTRLSAYAEVISDRTGLGKAFTDAPTLLARLADSLIRDRQPARAHHYFRLLLENYPTAPEAGIARRALHGVT